MKIEETKLFDKIIKNLEKNLTKLSGKEENHRAILNQISKLYVCLKQLVIQIEELENNCRLLKCQEKVLMRLLIILFKIVFRIIITRNVHDHKLPTFLRSQIGEISNQLS